MANMIKFYRGLLENLPATGDNGALYITTDEGAIYYGTGEGMKRLGDFIQVANVAALPEKAHESCLYYCVAENILAKWNGTEWKQINKQPTANELKTLLGLGSLAYLSEVSESNLNSDLAAKINSASGAQHSHDNKTVLDGITADKVAAWDASEKNAKDHADGLNTAMNTRVEALEAIDHSHTFVEAELNKIADGDVAKWNTASEKAHTHSFVESELNKIVDGDVAKWNAVVADHLTSADKTTLENSIKEAKKAGTDANTNIETYKVTNDARVLAVEEDIAEIVDGTNGILAQAKSYVDGKDSAMNTRVAALETAAPTHALKTEVEAVDAKFANYNTTVAQKAIDDAQDAEIAKKVDKVEGKSLISDSEITRLAGMSTGANKVEASTNGKIKIDGVDTVVYTHPEKHSISEVDGLQDALDGKQAAGNYSVEGHKHVKADITDFAHTHAAADITDLDATIKGYDYATKTELGDVDKKFANYVTSESYGVDKKATEDALADRYTKSEADGKFALIADAYDDTELSNRVKAIEDDYLKAEHKTALEGLISAEQQRAEGIEGGLRTDVDNIKADYLKASDKTELSNAIAAEKERAEGIEGGFDTRIKAIEDDYLKAADKTELEGKITANANAITALTDGIDPEKIDGLTDLVNWANTHAPEVEGIKSDIEANAKAIADQATSDAATYETKTDAAQKLTDAKAYTDAEVAKDRERISALESVKDDYKTADATLKSELQAEIDSDVKVVSDALDTAKTELNAAIEAAKTDASNKDAVVLSEAQKYTDAAKTAAIADAEGKVNALAGNVYTKEEVYTKTEIENLLCWGEF